MLDAVKMAMMTMTVMNDILEPKRAQQITK